MLLCREVLVLAFRYDSHMTPERYELADATGQLTQDEVAAGWHFCEELDGALVNANDCDIRQFCQCFGQELPELPEFDFETFKGICEEYL